MPDADRQRQNRHDHRVHSGAALVSAARTALSDAGERWTELRAAVFEQLARSDKPVSAYDIAEALGLERGKRVPAGKRLPHPRPVRREQPRLAGGERQRLPRQQPSRLRA